MKDIRRVAIAGAGTMGYSLAQAFSAAGYPVKLYDLFPAALDKARDMIALNQQTEVTSGKLTAEQSAALDRKSTRLNSSHDRQSRMPSSA